MSNIEYYDIQYEAGRSNIQIAESGRKSMIHDIEGHSMIYVCCTM